MKGIYVLEIIVSRPLRVRAGALGRVCFSPGIYLYAGSAQNGLEGRVARHCRKRKKRHWHIDYLLAARGVTLKAALGCEAKRSEECATARRLEAAAEAVPGFGSSGCTCAGHLFRVSSAGWRGGVLTGSVWHTLAGRSG